jgi:NTE family protein
MPRKPKTFALALGSGAARGLAHVGVLRVLEGAGLRPSAIAGTSMGAVVGALTAAGRTSDEIAEVASGVDAKRIFSLADPAMSRMAVLSGEKIERFLRDHLPATFAELEIPFACVSTDLRTGAALVHREGDLPAAVRASASIPLLFMPVETGGHVLVDGCLTDPIPVGVAGEMPGRVTVAVNVCSEGALPPDLAMHAADGGMLKALMAVARGEERAKLPTYFEIAATSLAVMERGLARDSLRAADVVIRPEVGLYDGYEFLEAERIIELGAEAAAAMLPRLARRLRVRL